jgi:hypothetical protein
MSSEACTRATLVGDDLVGFVLSASYALTSIVAGEPRSRCAQLVCGPTRLLFPQSQQCVTSSQFLL